MRIKGDMSEIRQIVASAEKNHENLKENAQEWIVYLNSAIQNIELRMSNIEDKISAIESREKLRL